VTKETEAVVLFDGVCNLCNGAVQFLIKRDKDRALRYASLQSPFAADLLAKFGSGNTSLDSMLVYYNGRLLKQSDAVIFLASKLGGIWKALTVFSIVPKFVRDGIYNFIARNRYRIFGKRDECMIPEPRWKDLFL